MSSKRKRRIILNLFEDDPIHVSRKQVDADDWMHILEFVETWKGEVLGRDLLRDLLRSIEVDPNDEEKRIIAFRTPTFLREMIPPVDANYLIPTTTTTTAPRQQQQQQQRLPDLSTLDELKVLELEGKGDFPIMKGLENLYNLQELKISFMCYGQLCTFSNEISRLSKLKKLVLGCSNLVSCLGPSLADLIAPTLQELYIQWNLQYSAMDYNKDNHDLLLSSSWKFWNLKVLDLGDPRFYQQNQSNQMVQLQLLCGLLSNCTKLEKIRMDMRDLIDLLTLEQSKEDNNNTDDHDHGEKKVQNYSWTSKLHDVTIDFGFVDVEYNEEIVASALQKIAQYMKSVRRLRLRFYYSNKSNVVDENRHHGTLVLPLSILHPL